MKLSIEMCGTAVLCVAVAACSNLRTSKVEPAAARVPAAESEQHTAENEGAQDQPGVAEQRGGRHENLTCYSGNDDRHARIGVELVNDRVTYFAYYSKWRPRTCSLEAGRGDARSRWSDNGANSTVTLADHRGRLRIEREGASYRFAFEDVDRRRYCGMPGKINGSLTVTRGKSSCGVDGVMDGHSL
jgi:hypothetical protein